MLLRILQTFIKKLSAKSTMKKTLVTLLALAVLGSSQAHAEEPLRQSKEEKELVFRATIGITGASKYLSSRGFTPHDRPSIQPFVSLSVGQGTAGNLTVGYWGSIDAASGEEIERDYTINLKIDSGPVSSAIGWGHYHLPSLGTLTELNGSVSLDRPLHPRFYAAYDYSELGSGFFSELSIGENIDLKNFPLEASIAVLYNHEYGSDGSGFAGFRIDVGVPIPLSTSLTITLAGRQFMSMSNRFQSDTAASATLSYTKISE